MLKKRKILYVAGPGNVIGTFEYWKKGQDDPSQVSMTFSGQFYNLCSELDMEGYIISSNPEKKFLSHGQFILEHRPIWFSKKSGIIYYLGQIFYELGLFISAIRFRADYVVGNATSCFFLLSFLSRFGIQFIPSFHCVLWPKYNPPVGIKNLLWKLNSNFFSNNCLAILSTSDAINEQILKITNNHSRPIVNFLSTYRKTVFDDIKSPHKDREIFQVLFAGRIEVDKGVFDLLEIAKRFKEEGKNNIIFNLCGTGSEFDSLQKLTKELDLTTSFILHGYCNINKMKQMFSLSHVVIVPTRSDFIEGLNQVVIEGVLVNRPVITSSVCPALSYVREAVVEVPPDNVKAYGDAIIDLYGNYEFYEEKFRNSKKLQEKFYDPCWSWGEALKSILEKNVKPLVDDFELFP